MAMFAGTVQQRVTDDMRGEGRVDVSRLTIDVQRLYPDLDTDTIIRRIRKAVVSLYANTLSGRD
jgi:hypothetical protein